VMGKVLSKSLKKEGNLDIVKKNFRTYGYCYCAVGGKDNELVIVDDKGKTHTLKLSEEESVRHLNLVKSLKAGLSKNDNTAILVKVTPKSAHADDDFAIKFGQYSYVDNVHSMQELAQAIKRAQADNGLAIWRTQGGSFFKDIDITYQFRSPEEAEAIAQLVSVAFPQVPNLEWGLQEIMINAIEHGNLEISYDCKKQLLIEKRWREEVGTRLADPRYSNRFASIRVHNESDHIEVEISDQGSGFDWRKYLDIDPERMLDPNGRGIALAKELLFDKIKYNKIGNRVVCRINL
jgi:hypothetical protein